MKTNHVVIGLASLLLAACGGGSDGVDASIDAPPTLDAVRTADGAGPATDAAIDAVPALPPGPIAGQPYLTAADSPFAALGLGYYHLEDMEDHMVNTPGVTADTASFGSDFGALVDSVDEDDGVIDDACPLGMCDSLYGGGQITFTFDAVALGALPTHVGVVWTDGGFGCDVTFEAFDAGGTSLGSTTATAIGDASNLGTTAEDHFFGFVALEGVGSIRVSNTTGGTEVDHLQYGR